MEHVALIEREIEELISNNRMKDALEYVEKKIKETSDIRVISLCMFEKAKIEFLMGRDKEGEKDLSKAVDLVFYINEKDLKGRLQLYIGCMYLGRGDVDNALWVYKEAEKNLPKGSYDYMRYLNNIGEIYKRIGKLDDALKEFKKCYKGAISKNYYRISGFAAENIAEIYALKGNSKKAEEYLNNSLHLFQKIGEERMIDYVKLSLYMVKNDRKGMDELSQKIKNAGFLDDIADAYYFFSTFVEPELKDDLLKEAILIYSELGNGHMREEAIRRLGERKV